ncbi:site-specific DNA-methyltransferase [Marinobacter hydrocarbonoclasticus]|uniref:site-specific DNA-methyltransferase n=1 Tax=Marinobacter nauticus TaxID=2743 RepID=UPI001A8FCC74|nr:site-specific DNA-methyltransferase [Marinobacter nauticus]MBN8241332.1 site-specific DNA-methyltransferase [Marinobacter nauticus]
MPILNWLNRDSDVKVAESVPYKLLEADLTNSCGGPDAENMLVQGDNLEALKALLPYYAGQVKCIYIDPPYNTRSAFEHYDDNLEHAKWLSMMYPRLELLWEFLSPDDGVILISINDDEGHYLKVMCDEIFGRKNFISSLVWNYEGNTDNQAKIINYHEYIHVYSKSGKIKDTNIIDPTIPETSKLYKERIVNTIIKNGPKNPISAIKIPSGLPASFEEGVIKPENVNFPRYDKPVLVKGWKTINEVEASSGWSSKGIFEKFIENKFASVLDSKGQKTQFELKETGAIEAIKARENKKGHFISVLRGFGTTNQMRLFLQKIGVKFTYPKPVDLISYLISAFSDHDDLIMDSFAGSGTTAHAVCKLNKESGSNRKFILIEMDKNNAENIIVPRLSALKYGHKEAGLESHDFGFKYYTLGASVFDNEGRINSDVKFEHLASHIWFYETKTAIPKKADSPLLGIHDGVAYYLLYNGILGDKRPRGGNVLTRKVLAGLGKHDGPKVIYGESTLLGPAMLSKKMITFKQTPYDVKAR